jgi:hypothetical protein
LKYISIPSSVPVQFLKRLEGRLGEKWIKESVGRWMVRGKRVFGDEVELSWLDCRIEKGF